MASKKIAHVFSFTTFFKSSILLYLIYFTFGKIVEKGVCLSGCPVNAKAPVVLPWKPFKVEIISILSPLVSFPHFTASFKAPSFASVPEFAKKTLFAKV